MEARRSQMTDVEDHAAKVSVEELITLEKDVEELTAKVSVVEQMQINTIKTVEKDLDHAMSPTKDEADHKTKTKGEICSDVEDQVSVEEQINKITTNNTLEKDLAHGKSVHVLGKFGDSKDFEDGNHDLVDNDDDEGEALKLLFQDDEERRFSEWAKIFKFYQSTEDAEEIGGGGDSFGASCWFD